MYMYSLLACLNNFQELASVAQLDVCPTGDQEVAGSIPAMLETLLCGD